MFNRDSAIGTAPSLITKKTHYYSSLSKILPVIASLLLPLALLLLLLQFVSDPRSSSAAGEEESTIFLPLTTLPMSLDPIPAPAVISTTEIISVPVLEASLSDEGSLLGLNKIGFHTGIGGNTEGLDEWMQALDAAGIPIFLKSADNAEPLYKAQELAKVSGVPHTLVFRRASGQYDDVNYDVPNYDLEPEEAALAHWTLHKNEFPPELDPSIVWTETINEIDKDRSEWLAEFALETARLAIADGFKWAAFGWSSGEPELETVDSPADWELPAMLDFLRFAASNPDQVAIALHEYSYEVDDIGAIYPFLIGRFQELFRICDKHGIDRPTVLITEWGWTHETVPEPEQAIQDINWASWMYSAYPEVKGAAIWYLGGNFDNVADQAQRLISPVQQYSLHNYFALTPGKGRVDPFQFAPVNPVSHYPSRSARGSS